MTLSTVHITSVSPDPEVYIDVATATNYIGAKFGAAPAAWIALTSDQKGQTLRQATLYLDQQPWDGVATGLNGADATTLQWPRSGVTRGDGTPVDSTTVPVEFPQACAELAILIAGNATITDQLDQGSNIQAANAGGGTGVTFFSPTSARQGTAPVMPVTIQRLVGKYLATVSASVEGGFGQAGRGFSEFSRCRQFTLVRGEE